MTHEMFDQLMGIRASGVVNMVSAYEVRDVADRLGYNNLSSWIYAHPAEYFSMIITGNVPWADGETPDESTDNNHHEGG
ncbi:hypothetical protein AGMMS49992_28180 [Clostridia bacterium]|nr:hypothetical protein AGMMS49992_28180 [Clostridia bacterium]